MKVAVWRGISGRQCRSRVEVSREKRAEDKTGFAAASLNDDHLIFKQHIKSKREK